MKNLIAISLILFAINSLAQTQSKNKGTFQEFKPGYYQNTIMKGIDEYEVKKAPEAKEKFFKLDPTGLSYPTSVDQFTTVWKENPISQGNTGTCWSFSTTSYFETEVYRLTKQTVDLSEIYTVYWEYVEKAKRFVAEKGNSNFDEGSEANALNRIIKMYGAMPANQYIGLLQDQKFHNHSVMVEEMKTFLASIKRDQNWNEEFVIATIKSILNSYLGSPPSTVIIAGKTMSPQDYAKNVLKLNMDDYIDVISLMEKPYYTQMMYNVPDNWWLDNTYYNVPLDTFMNIIKRSIKSGYSLSIGGDVSEAGLIREKNLAIVPTFDIPSDYIDENARQFRFSNKTTTDDHGMHLVGYNNIDGKDWYLIKDSSAGSRNIASDSKNFGYYFFSDDYIKLKMIDFMVHKDMVKNLLPMFTVK
jgi:bleomycin hydrolase